jgi:hypothetical protein
MDENKVDTRAEVEAVILEGMVLTPEMEEELSCNRGDDEL